MSGPICESCNDTKKILVTVGDGVLVDDQLRFHRASRPCPDCTDEGRAWEEAEQAHILNEHYAAAPPTCPTCGDKGFYWFLSLGRRVHVRCLACQPAPVDPWQFHS